MFARDTDRFLEARRRVNVSPLGAGALAGSTFPLDRAFTARELGMDGVCENSVDAVSDRDFAADFLYACAVTMMHLSRLAEEMVYWSSSEFRFLSLPDALCTGSSIMPQKKNPDVAELIRGKTGRAYGISRTSHADERTPACLQPGHAGGQGTGLRFGPHREGLPRRGESAAPGDGGERGADAGGVRRRVPHGHRPRGLPREEGVPFRKAHEITGRIVRHCEERGARLKDLSLKELRAFSKVIGEDVRSAISLTNSVRLRKTHGGTGAEAVRARLSSLRKK